MREGLENLKEKKPGLGVLMGESIGRKNWSEKG